MKRFLKRSIVIVAIALAACATTLIGKETEALEAVTAARTVATAQLRAKTITPAKDKQIQDALNVTRAAIDAAVKSNDAKALDQAKKDADALNLEKK